MPAFDVLADPVRRRILELLADGERTAGAVTDAVRAEFGISQPAVSQHLKVLRDAGVTTVRVDGARRLYAVRAEALREVDAWLDRFRHLWSAASADRPGGVAPERALPGPVGRLDALDTEVRRGRRRPTHTQTGLNGDRDDGRTAG